MQSGFETEEAILKFTVQFTGQGFITMEEKIMKKLLCVILSAVTAVSLAACGSSGTTATTAKAAAAGTTAAKAAAATTAKAAASTTKAAAAGTTAKAGASSGAAIKIGGIGPLTGPVSVYGKAVKNGEELAVKEINAKGEVKLELKFEDDEHDAEKSVNAYNTLKDWGMQILAGPVTTTPTLAVAAEAAKDKIFELTPSASAQAVIESGDNVFQICFTDPNQGVASADYIATKKLASKIGVIYDSSDAYSSGIFEKFKTESASKGLTIVASESFTSDNKTDLSTQVTKCKDAGAELIFLPMYYTEATQILTYANKIGYAPKFFGCDGLDGILNVEGFDKKLAEGVMLLTPFAADSTDEKTKNFVKAYTEAYGDKPNQFAADAYDVIYSIAQAAKTGKVTSSMKATDITKVMIEQFTSMKFDGLTGTKMTWDKSGAVSKEPKAVSIKNGSYAAMD
jgi:branched-chain amino acid transport system substrate-binding protein